ncbi:gamma-mobile-trio protein GmtX [Methylobacterium sp. AMS5]|uniref:gamma-mobile-trio protein GmtX n=1 Tax=Methylobacterium sp. AMS5 TaxID=925818 RepID=UPI00074F830D|nr:gamma-mobile-trio protein GmtX [Methylobacterium sp. AMS5]AMB44055.1 hypothetical protein Y590_04040 [Methylobacterium sp. AMS5]
MSVQVTEALAIVDRSLAELTEAATQDQVRVKLANLNEVCRVLVLEAAQRPTIPEVVRRYKARFPAKEHSLAEQSLRNKRGGANPYISLLKAWAGAAEFVLAPSRARRHNPEPTELLSPDEVAGIDNPALRHQVGLVLTQNRSLKTQLDILKKAARSTVLHVVDGSAVATKDSARLPLANELALNVTEVEALKDFVDVRKLRARGLRRAEDGAIESMDGRSLSDPGFVEAVEKIVRSYE